MCHAVKYKFQLHVLYLLKTTATHIKEKYNGAISRLHPLMFKIIDTITKCWSVQIILYETDTIKYILIYAVI